ncbi:MAG: membrane lipoprotein lipid attachment site-containing protein [Bacteroidales bacterium]|nr:membrane lipoprotein lipid attachment site-containing protein [Bacteroidales bacterium]
MMKKVLFLLTTILIVTGCTTSTTNKPTLKDYKVGEKWVWKWSRSVNGEVRAQGKDFKEVVDDHGTLGFWDGNDTVQITKILDQKPSSTPFRDWPLFVGKKWKFESEWENNEGTKGKTSQDVEVVSYEGVTVPAGKFMAYKIEYKGMVTNSRGYKGKMSDTWYYAPALKTYIKHVNDDGYGIYTNELISYSKAQ